MARRTIPQRELRNNVTAVLRDVESGAEFTITVRGRPVAELRSLSGGHERHRDVHAHVFAELLAATPVDERFATDVAALREAEEPVDDPWGQAAS